MGEKRGQVTIFVILGLAIVGLIFLASFLFLSDTPADEENPLSSQAPKTNSQNFIEECITPNLEDAIDKIILQGGYTYNKLPSLVYKFEDVSYLCYTSNYDENCVNLEPMFTGAVESELESYLLANISSCFDKLLEVYSEYDSVIGSTELDVKILPQKINLDLQKSIDITESGSQISFEDFSFNINSPLYTFLTMATEISNAETLCNCGEESCNPDYFKIDEFNRGFTTSRFTGSSGEKVYTIKYLRTGDEFNFAVRNCIDNR
ncbi:hypothetical protein HN747_02255 [archaeon]|nr:hypothetical protein [archaeon]